MKIKIKVFSTSTDTRNIVDTKTGLNKQLRIVNILGTTDSGDMLNCRTFNDCQVPETGKTFEFDMRRYDKKGMVADVLF